MALRPAPKRKAVDYQQIDELQKDIFGSDPEEEKNQVGAEKLSPAKSAGQADGGKSKTRPVSKSRNDKDAAGKISGNKKRNVVASATVGAIASSDEKQSEGFSSSPLPERTAAPAEQASAAVDASSGQSDSLGENLKDLETIAERIVSTKAGQGRNTTRPFSVPRTLIIDTTRLKAKFRTIDEQFTQNVIIDFLIREALVVATPENYRALRASAFEFIKRADETTRRSLTVTEDVVYQMSELKAGINLETGRKYSNDEIFSTLLAVGVSWLYRTGVLA